VINFLDVTLKLDLQGNIQTEIFRKPTDKLYSGLNFNSCHPQHLIKSLPYSSAIRSHRICSDPASLKRNFEFIRESFISRGYEAQLVEDCLNRAESITDSTVASGGTVDISDGRAIPTLVVDYNPKPLNIKNIVNKHFALVDPDNKIFKKPRVAYRRLLIWVNYLELETKIAHGPRFAGHLLVLIPVKDGHIVYYVNRWYL
jgi:hypothetical protein